MLRLFMWRPRNNKNNRKGKELESGVQRMLISRELMENVIRSMTNLLIVLNPDNTIRMVNPATNIRLGYAEGELINQPFSRIMDNYTLAVPQNWDEIDEEATTDYQVMLRAKNGALVPVFFTRSVMYDANGQVNGIVCVAQDITEMQQAEIRRESSALRYRALFEQSSDAIILADIEGRLGAVNQRCCELFGYTREEMALMRYTDLILSRSAGTDPEDSEKTFINLRSGKLVDVYEQTLRRKDGSTFVAEISAQMVRLKDGETHIQAMVRDITERRAAEDQLHFQAELLENVSDAVVAVDDNRIITHWNRGAELMYGWSAAEALGQRYDDLVQLEAVPYSETLFKEQYFERGYWLSEVAQRNRAGNTLYVAVSVGVLSGTGGGVVMINRDITARKTAELEAQRLLELSNAQFEELNALYERAAGLEKFKSLMIKLADHDLRSALASATMSFRRLHLDTHPGVAEHNATHVDLVNQSLDRARQVLDDLLSPNHLDALEHNEIIDLYPLTRQVVRELMLRAVEKSQELVTQEPQTPALLVGSRAQIYQALFNLIENAVKYTPFRKSITVSVSKTDTHAVFTVRDQGAGIPEAQQGDLFVQFSRLNLPEHEGIPGTGMGLFLVKSIVERHNGYIIFESVPGKGSMFGFAVPLYLG